MNELRYVDVDDCKNGMPYRKRTRLWNNLVEFKPTDLLNRACGNLVDGKHRETERRATSVWKRRWSDI